MIQNISNSNDKTKYLVRKNFKYKITSLSVGRNKSSELLAIIGEYDESLRKSQISIINLDSEIEICLEKDSFFNKILYSNVLSDSSYIISRSRDVSYQEDNENQSTLSSISSIISLWKYNSPKKFVSRLFTML